MWRGFQALAIFGAFVILASVVFPAIGWYWQSAMNYLVIEALSIAPMVAIVLAAAQIQPRGAVRLLAFRPLVLLGCISYGVYLYHIPVKGVLRTVYAAAGFGDLSNGPIMLALVTVATICVATLSWITIERPALRLKSHVPYR